MKNKLALFKIAILFALAFLPSASFGACTSPAGAAGAINESTGYKVCDGTTWQTISSTDTGVSCSSNKAVDFDQALQKHKICTGGTYHSVDCVTSSVGTGYCTASSQMKFTANLPSANGRFGYSIATSGSIMVISQPASLFGGSVDIYVKTAYSWNYQTTINNPASPSADNFGQSVAISGNTVIIGAPSASSGAGAAYVYTTNGTTWTNEATITPTTPIASSQFGASVDVYNNTAVVGTIDGVGKAYVFSRSGTVWSQQQILTGSTGTSFGTSVSVYDTSIAVGAYSTATNTGAVHIFTYVGSTWTQQQLLTASDATTGAYFGAAIDLQSNAIAIGSYGNNEAYYFTRSGSVWTQQKILTASDSGNIGFGSSISLYNTYIMVGAPLYSTSTGAAYVFTGSGSSWSQLARQIPSDGIINDKFGSAVAFSGTTAISASPYAPGPGAIVRGGAAYIIPLMGLKQKILSPVGSDNFGGGQHSMAISGDTVIIGAPGDSTNVGKAYIYVRDSGGVWSLQTSLNGAGSAAANFGYAVAIDGDTAVIGAKGETSTNAGAGKAYVYTRSGTLWTLKATLTGSNASNGHFGSAVAVSGGTIVVGEPNVTTNAGKVWIWTFDGTTATAQTNFLRPGGNLTNSFFGFALSLDTNTLVVSAPGPAVAGGVWVYNRTGTVWDSGTALTSDESSVANDYFGYDVKINGTTIAVGKPSTAASHNMSVLIFTGSGTSWTRQATILNTADPANNAQFGTPIDLHNNTLAVGDPARSGGANGALFYYYRVGTNWISGGSFTGNSGQSELYGLSVLADDSYVAATTVPASSNGAFWYYSITGDPVQSCHYANESSAAASGGDAAAASPTTSASVTLSSGQALLLCVAINNSTLTSVTWNGAAMALDASQTAGTYKTYVYSLLNPTPGSGTIVINSAAAAVKAYSALIVNGLATSSAFDKTAGTNGSSSGVVSSGVTATTSQAQEFAFGCIGANFGSGTNTANGWTGSLTQGSAAASTVGGGSKSLNMSAESGYAVLTSTGTVSASRNIGGTAQGWSALVATYKGSSSNTLQTTTCTDYGACSVAGALNYSAANTGVLWCDGANWRKIKAP